MNENIKPRTSWPPMKDDSERPAPFQHFKDEAERQQHLKEVEEAQKQGAPF